MTTNNNRKKGRYLLLAHCLLNDLTNVYEITDEAYREINRLIITLRKNNYRIVQLPCPEFLLLGKPRFPMTKEEYKRREITDIIHRLVADTKHLVVKLNNAGYSLVAIIGIKGSPSCGITETHIYNLKSREKGMGIFMELLFYSISKTTPGVLMLEFDYKNPVESVNIILEKLL